jgi:hypothetical protein
MVPLEITVIKNVPNENILAGTQFPVKIFISNSYFNGNLGKQYFLGN